MTREDYKIFRDEVLMVRFYWTGNVQLKKYLLENGFRYLFRCTHYRTDKYFWVFDKSDALLEIVSKWNEEHKKSDKKGVNEDTTTK